MDTTSRGAALDARRAERRRSARIACRLLLLLALAAAGRGADPFRLPAPLEDAGPQVEVPVFGLAAGHDRTDESLAVTEWVAKRTWHLLGLPWERKDFTGPPSLTIASRDGWIEIEGTVADGGVPLRNQVVTCGVEQLDRPVLALLRSADAFGEVLIELDLLLGRAQAWSVTVSRSMVGGQSHSSPMPGQSSSREIRSADFQPLPQGPVALEIRALGADVTVEAAGEEIFSFADPDPAGGKLGFGSTGRIRVRDVEQWELISPREMERRDSCLAEMRAFSRSIDALHEGDVRARNRVERTQEGLAWTWPSTGATATFRVEGPRVLATVRSGLYGDPILADGPFPEVEVEVADGSVLTADPEGTARIDGDATRISLELPLRGPGGTRATARATAKLTVQTVWFWTVSVEGAAPRSVRALLGLAPTYGPADARDGPESRLDPRHGLAILEGGSFLRHDGRAGLHVRALEGRAVLGTRPGRPGVLGIAGEDPALRFATVVLPAQRLNLTGFKHRMVHFIRYPEGPVEGWRRGPSPQEYPTDVDLARYAGHGADAMVWHHTWSSSDFRDREGFLVNDAEMRRAMAETHRLGMKAICYLGIVPGRSSLLGFEDTCSLGGGGAYGGYGKNWDLQDQTFYHVAGRYPEFIAWMADRWAKEYAIDGFYLDGGAFGLLSKGATKRPVRPEDAGLSLEELQHLAYWRVKKVLERNGAPYGFEPWSGLDWLLNGFYDCMMIGESFQEAPPEYYRDGHNALLTGCSIKMYGMRESSQNPYNIAMAAVNLGDIQVCSGNGAWGDDPDTADTWRRVRPLWDLLDSIDWDHLVEARPWYAQELVTGTGFFAGTYVEPRRAIVFLANRSETPGVFAVRIDPARLPTGVASWRLRYCLGRNGDIGPLGDGTVEVALPALHDGPVGIEVLPAETARAGTPAGAATGLATGSPAAPDARPEVARAFVQREPFVPSVEGKKLLSFGGPVEGDDAVAFDGSIVGGAMPFFKRLDPEEQGRWAADQASKRFGRHTDNFCLAYSYPGKGPEDFDWFDDLAWIVENWRILGRAARAARFRGICFDSEYYEGLPLFGWHRMRHATERDLEEHRARVREVGAAAAGAVAGEFPEATILVLFGFSGTWSGVPQHPVSRMREYSLVAAFVDGLLAGGGPAMSVHDMHEQSFSFRVPGSFARARAMMTDVLPERSHDPVRYLERHRVGFSFWADCWGDTSKGRALDLDDFETNYYTPAEMAWAIHHALAWSDGYAWMWPGAFDWWKRTARTLDREGKEVAKPLPPEYLEALRTAHLPDPPAPPRERRPNTWRVVPAASQEGWSDAETFGDLWDDHTPIADLPDSWRFRVDPDEVGRERGWHLPGAEDPGPDEPDWAEIRIREFWEVQGWSPHDGAAWYRLVWTVPPFPPAARILLAFGGVADEAQVFLDGRLVHASRFGENIRHRRLLVDVTGLVRPGATATLAVRVWNTGWCGGIWKGVKLVARRIANPEGRAPGG